MKDNNLYFDNVPYIGSLFMEQLLFSFEDTPIVFICTDKELSRYLCVCDDIIDEESWLIVKVNNTKLLEILNDVSTVLSAFVGQKVIIANKKFNQSIQYEIEEYNNHFFEHYYYHNNKFYFYTGIHYRILKILVDRDDLVYVNTRDTKNNPVKIYLNKFKRQYDIQD